MRGALAGALVDTRLAVGMFGLRGWLLAAAGAAGTLLLIGTVAAIFDNPYFTRMTEVRAQDYAFWAASALLVGLTAGTFGIGSLGGHGGKLIAGGVGADLAVGCPICNKIIVALIGTSGALTFFAPAQLLIGFASIALLTWTLVLRSRAVAHGCRLAATGRV